MSHANYHHRNPRARLTPAMHKLLERIERAGHVPLHAMTPVQAREAYNAAAGVLDISPQPLERVESFTVDARDGFAVPVRLYAPAQGVLPVLVYLHGGGFTIGNIETHEVLCRRLAHLAASAVLSVDYRLAPEHKFPTAVWDCWDVLQWVLRDGAEKQLDTRRVAIGGDSAGGTLSAVCALLARDAGQPLALQLLFYPGTGGHQATESHRTYAKGFLLEETHIRYFFDHYLRGPQDRDDWRFAPLDGKTEAGEEADLAGVAPAWIGLAECDPLVDEGVQYADRLRMAGVPVDLEIYRGMVHDFIKMGRAIPEAAQAHADAARALKEAFSG